MAKTVTFTDLTTPDTLAGVASTGGTLTANTTYYYVVQAVFTNGTTTTTFNGKSLSSNEISVTTDTTNKSVTLTWNHPKGEGGGYRIFRATSSGAYLGCINDATNMRDSVINNAGVCTYVDTGTALAGNVIYQNTSHGKLILSSTAPTTDIWSITDLYDADVAGGWGVVTRLDQSTYRVEPYLICHSGTQWVDEIKTIIFADAWETGGGTGVFRFGRKTGSVTMRGCHIILKGYWLTSVTFPTLYLYKSLIECVTDWSSTYSTYDGLSVTQVFYNAGVVEDVIATKTRYFAPQSTANCTMKNTVVTYADIAFSLGQATFTNVTGTACSRLYQTTSSTVMRAKDAVNIGSTYTILIIGSHAQITMVNTNVPASSYAPVGDCHDTYVNELFTYNLTVNKNGSATPISGASVKIWDVFNNLICDTTTDASGKIAEQELIFRKQTYSAVPVRTSTEYSPHKMVITASGYETYTQYTTYTAPVATSHIIGLTPIVPVRQTIDGDLLLANQPELGSGSKVLKL